MRDNMSFVGARKGEFVAYFIGYARSRYRMGQMLKHMLVGLPPVNHERLLDYRKAVTGTLFFCLPRRCMEDPCRYRNADHRGKPAAHIA